MSATATKSKTPARPLEKPPVATVSAAHTVAQRSALGAIQFSTLRVSSPKDSAEKEADSTAKKVMRMPEKAAPQEPKEKPTAGPAVARKAGAAVQEREPAKANNVARKVGAPVKEKEPATAGNVARKSAAEVKQKEPASAAGVARKEKPEVKERESGSPGNVARKAAEVKEKEAASAAKPARKEKAEVKEREASGAKPVARSGDGAPNVGANVQSDIERAMASGNPLPLSVRQFMEPRFNADFCNVKIHTDNKSASLSRQLSAQAFTVGNHIFFGRDRFQPEQSEGRELIAHELTHTIQQGAVTQARGVQRSAEPEVKERSEPKAQRLGISDALDYFADKAYNIPGYRMFTIVLGINPINMSRVDRSAANIMRAIVEFIPGGNLITRALDNHGVFDKVGNWVEQQIRSLGMTGAMIRDAVMEFLDSLGWRDIFDLGGVWNRAKRIFTEPIDRLINFAKGLINGILEFVKDAILRPLAELASQTRAWDLLIAVLGVNPITGDPVPRNADTLIGGFMKLIGQEEVWLNIKRGNAIARAWAWFQGALSGVMGFVRQIPSLFMQTLRSLTIVDLVTVVGAFNKVRAVFGGFAGQFISWAMGTVIQLLEILFSVVAPGAMPYIRRAAGAFQSILRNPIGFVGNLVRAARLGFQQFARNIGQHLRNSLIQWLTGAMAGAGLYIPQALTFQEIIKFVLSVMGLTWQNIRQKLVRAIGETPVRAMETGFEIVRTLVTEGPAAAWQQIREGISNLQQMVIEQIRNFVVVRVVQAAITRLITSLNPAGAVIQAIIAIYNTIMFFIERMRQIAQVAGAFINSISAIASGAIGAAANRVEQTMAGLLTLVISFLARLVGLGRVSDAVTNIINRIRAPIDRALDRVVAWIVRVGRAFLSRVQGAAAGIIQWWRQRKSFRAGSESHSMYFSGERQTARLIVASNPMPIEDFVNSKRAAARNNSAMAGAIAAIDAQLPRLRQQQARPEPEYEQAQREIQTIMNSLTPHVAALLSGTEWGTEENPLPLRYTKRSAGAYRVLYFGPRTGRPLSQSVLASGNITSIEGHLSTDEVASWRSAGRTVRRYLPTQRQALPDGGPTIGISADNQVAVGLKRQYQPGRTAGGGLINRTLAPYGYRASAEGMDGDHVVEMQIGGQNVLENLWPLAASENRSSGAALSSRRVRKPDGTEFTLSEAHAQKSNPWIMITETLG